MFHSSSHRYQKVFDPVGRIITMSTVGYQKELRCQYCNEVIFFDDKFVSKKTGKKYPMDPETGERHRCQQFYDAMKIAEDEKIRKESEAFRQRLKDNAEKSKRERTVRRRAKMRTEEYKAHGSPIDVKDETNTEEPVIERRPPAESYW